MKKNPTITIFLLFCTTFLFSQTTDYNFEFENDTVTPWRFNNETQKYNFDTS